VVFIGEQNSSLPPFRKGGLGRISKLYTFVVAAMAIGFSLIFIHSGEAKKPKVVRNEAITKKELKSIYSQMYCTKCGDKSERTLNKHNCEMAKELRTLAKARLEEGHSVRDVIWNFNGDNIAFIYDLPQGVIRQGRCPCACDETIEICIAELRGDEKVPKCPVIDEIMADIHDLNESGLNELEIINQLKESEYQIKYAKMIAAGIQKFQSIKAYADILAQIDNLPDALLDDSECPCACTESLRTCIQEMPWCERIPLILRHYEVYIQMGLTTEEAAAAMPAPCGKTCAKNVDGAYLGINGDLCTRPIRDKAYYRTLNGKKMVFCCESCYAMEEELPDEILDNVVCKTCDFGLTLREDKCPLSEAQKMLIKSWLLEGKTTEWIIYRFSEDYDPLKEEW